MYIKKDKRHSLPTELSNTAKNKQISAELKR